MYIFFDFSSQADCNFKWPVALAATVLWFLVPFAQFVGLFTYYAHTSSYTTYIYIHIKHYCTHFFNFQIGL